jgi:hypothetical protein
VSLVRDRHHFAGWLEWPQERTEGILALLRKSAPIVKALPMGGYAVQVPCEPASLGG